MSNPLVSVVMPAYNHEHYIEEGVRSLIAQTYTHLELLIIDDGSKDKTWEILNRLKPECEKRFERVVLLHQENQGICRTLNKLYPMTSGKYIFAIDSDDAAAAAVIEKEVSFLEENPEYVLAVCNNDFIDADSRPVKRNYHGDTIAADAADASPDFFATFFDMSCLSVDFFSDSFGSYASLLLGNYVPNGYLIRCSALPPGKQVFSPQAPLEDWHLMLYLAKQGKMKYLHEVLFHYRWHGNNTMQRKGRQIARKTFLYEKKCIRKTGTPEQKKIWADMAHNKMTQDYVCLYLLSCRIVKICGWLLWMLQRISCSHAWGRLWQRVQSDSLFREMQTYSSGCEAGRMVNLYGPERMKCFGNCRIGDFSVLKALPPEGEITLNKAVVIGKNCSIETAAPVIIGEGVVIRDNVVINCRTPLHIPPHTVIEYNQVIRSQADITV